MKFKTLAIIGFVVLFIWNAYLGIQLISTNTAQENITINEIELSGFSTDFTEVIEEVIPSVCTIRTEQGLSSGFVYAQKEGKTYVLTAYHGLQNAGNVQVIFDNDLSVNATIVASDTKNDLSLLEMDFAFEVKPLAIGDASVLKTGEFAIVIGTPISLEYSNTVSLAMISDHHRILEATNSKNENYYRSAIQFTSTLNEGNSGGPLINMDGQLIGMNVMQYAGSDGEGVYFATPSNEIKLVADLMMEGLDYTKHQFGIKGNALSSMPNYKKVALGISIDLIDGYYVSSVRSNQIAQMAGLLHGDVIVAINDEEIKNEYDLMEIQYDEVTEFVFEVDRFGERLEFVGYPND